MDHEDQLQQDHRTMNLLREQHLRGYACLVGFEQITDPSPLLLPVLQPMIHIDSPLYEKLHEALRDRKDLVEALRLDKTAMDGYDNITFMHDELLERFKNV